MKKLLSLLLAVVMTACVLAACAPAAPKFVEEITAGADGHFDVTAPTTAPEGQVFRGYFTEPEGQGVRVTSATVADAGTVAYAHYTDVHKMINEVYFTAFGVFMYNHTTFTDTDGVKREIGYRGKEEDFRSMKEFGIDMLLTIDYYHDAGTVTADALQNIKWCEQYGMQCYVNDPEINRLALSDTNENADRIRELASEYIDSPAVRGFYIGDEPGMTQLAQFKTEVVNLRALFPEKDCHINLCTLELIAGTSTLANYYSYFNNYVDTFHFSTDPYPYGNSTDEHHVYKDFFTELRLAGQHARKGDRPLWMYLQVTNFFEDSYRKLKFNLYADMAYGNTNFVLFLYNLTHWYDSYKNNVEPTTSGYAMLDAMGTRTEAWYAGQRLVQEIDAFKDVFSQYTWESAGLVKGSQDVAKLEASGKVSAYKGTIVSNAASNGDVIVSEFNETNGDGAALMLFNATDATEKVADTVMFRLDGASNVHMYLDGVESELTPSADGVYTVTVPDSTGVFITMEYYN